MVAAAMVWARVGVMAAAAVSVAAAAAVPSPPSPDASLTVIACDNGLTAVIDPRPGSRTVFAEIAVRAGSRDEPLELAGMSHLLEHLLFQEGHGAIARPNPAFSALRQAGALVNASTDFEQTEYHADLPAERFAEGWDALVSMVTRAGFTTADVDRERRVVLQEAALGKTDPVSIVAWSVLGRMFPGDPIAQPVIGFRRSLRRIRHADLMSYYRRFYTPANMFAVIVGDVDPQAAAARVRSTLGALPAGGTAHAPYGKPAVDVRPLYRFRTLVKQSYLLAGALTGGETSPDALELSLLSTLLGEGRTSRLHERLVRREALTDDILEMAFQVSTVGALAAGVAVDPDRQTAAREALLDEMRRLAREPVPVDELASARHRMEGALAREMETNEGIAGFRARRLLLGQPLEREVYLARLASITPDDLLAVARRHWGDGAERPGGLIEIQVLPARGFGKVLAALRFLFFRRL